MGKLVLGFILLVILGPLFMVGAGESIMAIPIVGICIASFASWLLRARRGSGN